MPVVIYDVDSLHPDDLTGILDFETQIYGIVNEYPTRRFSVRFESFDVYANSDRTLRVYVKTPELNIINLTGATGVFTIKASKSDTVATIQKSTAVSAQGQIGSPDQGEMFFYLVPADTATLAIRQYVYDVRVTLSTGKAYTVLEGTINLQQPVG